MDDIGLVPVGPGLGQVHLDILDHPQPRGGALLPQEAKASEDEDIVVRE